MSRSEQLHIVREGNRLLIGVDTGAAFPAKLSISASNLLCSELSYVEKKFLRGRELFDAKRLGLPRVQEIAWECFGFDLKGRLCTSFGFLERLQALCANAGWPLRYVDLKPCTRPAIFEPRWDRVYDGSVTFRHRQEEMLLKIFANENGQFSCPPGWGKSFLLGLVARALPKAKIGVTTRRVPVLLTRIYPELCGMLPDVGVVGGGRNNRGHRVMCYTLASLQHCPADIDYLFIDECFPRGTLIDGRPIETLRPGDVTASFNHASNRVERKPILRVIRRHARALVRITLSNGAVVRCTPEHPIYSCESAAYIAAHTLKVNSSVLGQAAISWVARVEVLQQGRDAEFASVCPDGSVYNLEVADNNNYFAGPGGLLVHNCHEAAADDSSYKLSRFKNARMFGFSATLEMRLDHKDMRCEAMCGPVRMVVTYQECVDAGIIVPIEVQWRNVIMDEDPCVDYEDTDKKRWGLWRNDYRNAIIAEDAQRYPGQQVLVTCETIEHVLALKKVIPAGVMIYHEDGMSDKDYAYFIKHSLIPDDFEPLTRQLKDKRIERLKRGAPGVYLATTVLNVGVDCRYLGVLCRADGGGSPINDTQIPGRTSRINERGKRVGIIHDYLDQFNRGFRVKASKRFHSYEDNAWTNVLPDRSARSWLSAQMDWD